VSGREWSRAASAAGFDVDELVVIADFVARGVVTVDGAPIEVLPDFWVIPGYVPYDGLVILAAVDRRGLPGIRSGAVLSLILSEAVAARA
jgi:hypothetical protein